MLIIGINWENVTFQPWGVYDYDKTFISHHRIDKIKEGIQFGVTFAQIVSIYVAWSQTCGKVSEKNVILIFNGSELILSNFNVHLSFRQDTRFNYRGDYIILAGKV